MSAPDGDGRRPWPSWVYGVGTEPDPASASPTSGRSSPGSGPRSRCSRAAWHSTRWTSTGRRGCGRLLASLLVVLGLLGSGTAWLRWAATERAMRLRRPLPSTAALAWIALALMAVAICLVVLVL